MQFQIVLGMISKVTRHTSEIEHVYMIPKVNSNRFEMSFRLYGNLHGDFNAATFQTIARPYCACANDIF